MENVCLTMWSSRRATFSREKRRLQRTSCVEDVEHAGLAVNFDLLTVGVLNGGIIFMNEVVLGQL
jgi:hypothetical protein